MEAATTRHWLPLGRGRKADASLGLKNLRFPLWPLCRSYASPWAPCLAAELDLAHLKNLLFSCSSSNPKGV